MKLKELEGYLGTLEGFDQPKVKLEQYTTRPHIAARILHTIESHFEDIKGKVVLDLGCGSGVFLVGASLLGARQIATSTAVPSCIGVDIDDSALETCARNCREFDLHNVDFIQADAMQLTCAIVGRPLVDIVITNPPFGTKRNQGVDMLFLRQALLLAQKAVYSLHKTSTREHVFKKATDWKVNMEVLAELRFDLPATYSFHKHKSVDVAVDFIRFSHVKSHAASAKAVS